MAEDNEKRTLIETFLPVAEISEEAKKEKNGRPPTFEMHYWWTRKPLITARAAVLGSLLPADFDVQEFKRLLGLDYMQTTGKRAFNYSIPDDRIQSLKKEYKKVWKTVPTVLDPFAGGGSIPFEAMRLGIESIASDYNPVSILLLKATLEFPQKYGDKLYKDVKKGLFWIFEETRKELGDYYPKQNEKDVVAYIWAWVVKCAECGFANPLVGQWWLCKNDKKICYLNYKIQEEEGNILKLSIETKGTPPQPNCVKGKGKCIKCGSPIKEEIIKKEIFKNDNEYLLALVLNNKKGKSYEIPSNEQIEAFKRAKNEVDINWQKWVDSKNIDLEEIPTDVRGSLSAKIYLKYWHRILNPRQKLLFITLISNICKYYKSLDKNDEEYNKAIMHYLILLLGKQIDYNCRSANWIRSKEIISSTMGQRGVGMMWDHTEVNPFVKGSGTLLSGINSILKGIEFATQKLHDSPKCTISNYSVTANPHKTKIIVTDPPYFDDVRYAEFSEFFYSWEKKALECAAITSKVPNKEEMSVGGWGRDKNFFSKLFNLGFKHIYEILDDDGILVMFFAHSSIDAWDFVINSLKNSKFSINATWPVHTESTNNPLARGHASIMSSIIIVARKRKEEKSGYIEEIHDELQDHLSRRLDEFWKYGLRAADLTVASMGATLDIITQYSEIKSYTGEMTIKDVLELVQDSVTHYVLQRYMKNAESLDAPTAFYLYTRFSGLEGMPFDTANLIAKSMKIDLKVLEKEHLIESVKSKKTGGIKIQTFKDREDLYRRTIPMSSMINAVHYMMAAFAHGGYDEVQQVLSTIPYGRNEIRDILEAFQSLPPGDPERQIAQQILERMGTHFPKTGQQSLDKY